MASIESKLFILLLKLIRKKELLQLQFAFGKFDFYKSQEPPPEVLKHCHVAKKSVEGRNVFTLSPRTGETNKRVLYLHGGAYVQNFVKQHWTFLAYLVRHARCTVIAPDYPLAPKHTYKDSYLMVTSLYRELISQCNPNDFIVMGDSAGGGFALGLAQNMKELGIEQPSQIILLSPWLDLALKNPEIKNINPSDPFLGIHGLQKAGLLYAGGTDLENYLLSPIYGPLEGLGKISVFIGSRDLLVADTRKLAKIMKVANEPLNYFEYEDMIHVWMLLNFPESKVAKEQIINLINQQEEVLNV